jgi:ABC-type transport system substrate-binding protein
VAVFGADGEVHGMLAESIVPNSDYTQWTVTLRDGISFTDGTPVDADAVISRLRDPDVDAALDAARDSSTDEEAIAAAEDINRVFAEQCYFIPITWVQWAALGVAELRGFGDLTLPDGTVVLDGAGVSGASGEFWMPALHLADSN